MEQVDYSLAGITPAGYQCAACGVSGVKLWRYHVLQQSEMLCAVCASADQQVSIDDIDGNGKHTPPLSRIDQIGYYVPAVPDGRNGRYFAYTDTPEVAARWWRLLPTLKPGTRLVKSEEEVHE